MNGKYPKKRAFCDLLDKKVNGVDDIFGSKALCFLKRIPSVLINVSASINKMHLLNAVCEDKGSGNVKI